IEAFRDVSFFLGHTASDYETAKQAIKAGAKGVTHTFNQMEPFHHRSPGLIGAAIESNVFCECITDGLHVHPSAVRLLFQAVGRERFVSITDSLRPTGLKDGEYVSGGRKVIVKDRLARLESGVIAGSTLTMLEGAKNLIRFGIRPEDAFYVSSATPAKAAGIFDKAGSISAGKRADLLILDPDYSLKEVLIGGVSVS
ncbi:MAG: amidohydrolase family protein, partial [Lachnospiraceae bacterium]|nr:amidohydrolase family protein [Lachnospiraceae bacterium]